MLEYDFEDSVGYWICMTSRALEHALNEELAPHGITYRQWQVLCWLALEKELSQNQLANRIRVEAPTLVGILDSMERKGWIRRRPSIKDRRKKIIVPTPRVQSVWKKIAKCARKVRARATNGISSENLELVKKIMGQMQENLKNNRVLQESVS